MTPAWPPQVGSSSERGPQWGHSMISMFVLALMGDAGSSTLVDKPVGSKTIEAERCGQRVRLVARNCMCQHVSAGRRGFKTTGAPAAVDEQVIDGGCAD